VNINCTGGDPAELGFSLTVNYLSAATPACDITSSCDSVLAFTPIAPIAAAVYFYTSLRTCQDFGALHPAASASATEQNQRFPLLKSMLIFEYQRPPGS
jgi:hypothetical protein